MKFNEYAGSIDIDVSHIHRFVPRWYSPDDLIVLSGISVDSPYRRVLSQTIPARELAVITAEELGDLCHEGGYKYNTYLSCFPVKDDNAVHTHSRGTKEDIKEVFGVYADLDVKPGCFESKEEIRDFLFSLEAPPTLIIDNGKYGGVHAYWRLHFGLTTEENILLKWWCYLTSKTIRNIDRLKDSTRILRLPSGIYWGDGVSDTVKLVVDNGPTYSLEQLLALAQGPFDERQKKIANTISREHLNKQEIGALAKDIFTNYSNTGFNNWSTRLAVSKIEQIVNDSLTWDEVLCPHGWTYIRALRDGAHEWARPGQNRRSAVTDYTHEDGTQSNVMSLLSQSQETGLMDLVDARIPLTKYRVLLRLKYDDNEIAMLNDMRSRIYRKK